VDGSPRLHAPDGAYAVVPAYNEARVLEGVLRELLGAFRNVVVVDDGSTDGTRAILAALPVLAVHHPINIGQGAALQTGIAYALERGAATVVTFDADGQHRVEDAVAAVAALEAFGCDVVCGSRFLGAGSAVPPVRRLILRTVVAAGNLTRKRRRTDAHNGLRAMTRRAAASLDITQSGMAHASQIVGQFERQGLDVREIPVQVRYTEYSLRKGQSSLNAINIAVDLVIGRLLK
jgi:glycosyltransferase involved in cell wall biosynthesis